VKPESFSKSSCNQASGLSVLLLYEILLGRDPESSFVIEEAKTQPIRALFQSFVESPEFRHAVVQPMQTGSRLRHECAAPGPTSQQCRWILSLLAMDSNSADAMSAAKDWRQFFDILLRFCGFWPAKTLRPSNTTKNRGLL
jgi:hypothetical protein